MALLGNVLGFATFGFLTRVYALALQRRPIFEGITGYVVITGGFGTIGYWLNGIQQRQIEAIEIKKQQLIKNREKAETETTETTEAE